MDNSTKPIGLEVQPSDQLLTGYEGVMGAVDDDSLISELGVYDQQMVQEIRKYQENPAQATSEEWSHYNSRVNGLGLYHSLEENGLLNWNIPAFTGSTNSMSLLWTNLDKQENEMVIKIITGAESPDFFDSFTQAWSKQGGASILEEVRAQRIH